MQTYFQKSTGGKQLLMTKTFIIAEAGVNHNGSKSLAMDLIEIAAESGADAIKFQTFTAENLVRKGTLTAEYQQQHTGNQDQYAMLKELEISKEFHYELVENCIACGIEFMSTPFDIESAHFLSELGMKKIKVPSGELTNLPFLRALAELNLPMILSTGMASLDEVEDAISVIDEVLADTSEMRNREEMLTVLHCTSNYPTKNEDVNLRAIQTMRDEFMLPVGYSDHTQGILVSTAAVAMGATVIEKHFTKDKSLKGPDHQASLEPDELALMVKQIRQVESCLGDGIKVPKQSEYPIRELVRRSVVLKKMLKKGAHLNSDDLILLRPGSGILPKHIDSIVGKTTSSDLPAGKILKWDDFC